MGERHRAEPRSNIDNHLRSLRLAKGLTQGDLARMAGITRQAIYAIESNVYLPTTAVALRLARALDGRVEDLFNLHSSGEILEGRWGGPERASASGTRVKVAHVGGRWVVKPSTALGDVLALTVPADGLLLGPKAGGKVRVELLRDRRVLEQQVVVAGCDPAIFLVSDYVRRRHGKASVVGWTIGSAAALDALKRGEVHMAGLHLRDADTGESNLPYLRRHLKGDRWTVVTFAEWQQGFVVAHGNPKGLRGVEDLARPRVRLMNREEGSGARSLLNALVRQAGIPATSIVGWKTEVSSHLAVARAVADGRADVGISVEAAARLFDLTFIPLQAERYDLVIPAESLKEHVGLSLFLDALVSRPFRAEIEALGGYDTHETGQVRTLRAAR